jgi:hypothetical protein
MKLQFKMALASFLILLVGCTNLTTYDPSMYHIQFGLLQKTDAEKYTVIETDSISQVSATNNQVFGYLITPKHNNKYVYNAVVVLPNKQQILEGNVMEEKEPAISQEFNMGDFKAQGASTIKMWLSDGDEKGIHKIKLYINGALADSSEFLTH